MTIQLTTACFINGSLAASGSQHTLDEATEAGLIYQGMATRVGSAPDQDGVVNPAFISTASGSPVLMGPDGAISTGAKVTSIYAASALTFAAAISITAASSLTACACNTVLIDENGTADVANNKIGIPVGATQVQFFAKVHWNHAAVNNSTATRIAIKGWDDTNGVWEIISTGNDTQSHPTGIAISSTQEIYTAKLRIPTDLVSVGAIPFTFFRLEAAQITGTNLATASLGGNPVMYALLEARFFM